VQSDGGQPSSDPGGTPEPATHHADTRPMDETVVQPEAQHDDHHDD
jgi:hypothetical protein